MAIAEQGTAIVAITRRGAELGRRLRALLPDSALYVAARFAVAGNEEQTFSRPAASLIQELFGSYRQLVLVMAAGVAVRSIVPVIKNKRTDPGVVVVDDAGRFAVSLLSGHLGGANRLAGEIASLLGAQPVITTASDALGQLSFDLLGQSYGWRIEDSSPLTTISAALVNGEKVGVYQDAGETGWQQQKLPVNLSIFNSLEALVDSECSGVVVITDRLFDSARLTVPVAVFRPASLIVGLGCNRGTECADIEAAVARVFADHGLSMRSIRELATVDIKKDEAGISQFAASQRLTVRYIGKTALATVACPSAPSAAAIKHVGSSVCEAAALLSGGNLVIPKTGFKRRVTVAVVRLSPDTENHGKLFVVGTGPGALEQMTLRARQAIAESEVVVGYKTYLDQITALTAGKEVIATGMGKEVARVNRAIDRAGQGKVVALVSGGDSGVYGMSGLVGEVLEERGVSLAVEIVPGVPAMVAAGALLGAPLTGDVASISLSDYLIPWQDIARRLEAAAKADFVIALYNPRSKSRRHQLKEAREIILRYRQGATPVGIVSNAFRRQQAIILTDLDHMLEHAVDMNTTVIIGNSGTFLSGGWMVTPRGYRTKYDLGET